MDMVDIFRRRVRLIGFSGINVIYTKRMGRFSHFSEPVSVTPFLKGNGGGGKGVCICCFSCSFCSGMMIFLGPVCRALQVLPSICGVICSFRPVVSAIRYSKCPTYPSCSWVPQRQGYFGLGNAHVTSQPFILCVGNYQKWALVTSLGLVVFELRRPLTFYYFHGSRVWFWRFLLSFFGGLHFIPFTKSHLVVSIQAGENTPYIGGHSQLRRDRLFKVLDPFSYIFEGYYEICFSCSVCYVACVFYACPWVVLGDLLLCGSLKYGFPYAIRSLVLFAN